jgi:hemerythrin-like metal-binding protein
MEWTDKFSVGVAMFDGEHKKLVGMINDLYDSVASGAGEAAVRRVSDDLVEYTFVHFGHEEMYFDDAAYPQAVEHAAIHADLKRRVFEYRDRIDRDDDAELAVEMLKFLRGWLAHHIMVEDKKYGAHLNAKGIR